MIFNSIFLIFNFAKIRVFLGLLIVSLFMMLHVLVFVLFS